MKDRPILFSGAMVLAMLEGRKTQTRRVVKGEIPPEAISAGVISSDTDSNGIWWWLDPTDLMDASPIGDEFRCPYGVPGDLLWVRESGLESLRAPLFKLFAHDATPGRYWVDSDGGRYGASYSEACGREHKLKVGGWRVRPGIHMPRWANRLTLRVTDVRVERLHDISVADCLSEGAPVDPNHRDVTQDGSNPVMCLTEDAWRTQSPRAWYHRLWANLNGEASWEANPWVWVVSFDPIQKNVDAVIAAKEAA